MNTTTNPYDLMPYSSNPYPNTHPNNLAAIATIFGLSPVALDHCRVLEIGCASGENLLPIASTFPKAQFVGLDYSQVQISKAQQVQKELELSNIEFLCEDLSEVDPTKLGRFDYVIAHGIYSWLPPQAQAALLKLCRTCLTENGVAYVSYNTLPGWHMRKTLREFMLFHASSFGDGPPDVYQAKALLDFMATHLPAENNPVGQYLRAEIQQLTNDQDFSALAHDYLEENNEPIYFSEFIARAQLADLDYLGEAEFFTMFGGNIAPDAKLRLTSEIKDIVRLEQYFDFMTNRTFRMTLMVPKGAPIVRNITADRLGTLWIAAVGLASGLPMTAKALSSNKSLHYQVDDNGPFLDTSSPVTKAAFVVLAKFFPANLQFEEILRLAREHLSTDHNTKVSLNDDRTTLAMELFFAYSVNLLKLSVTSNQALSVSDLKGGTKNNLVAEHIRYQARTSNFVTNLNHERISLDEGARQILLLLDGTKDELSLKETFCEFMRSQELVIKTQKGKKIIPKVDSPEVSGLLTAALEGLAKASLLTRN
jgi:methyltransferase-like protein/ubiquinone/menaquinone biosynthesis C-methylase UbiE